MPQAFLSGSLGAAATVRGAELLIFRYDEDQVEVSKPDALSSFFSGAWDVTQIAYKDEDDLRTRLRHAWSGERAVQLLQIYLDSFDDEEIACEAVGCLNEMIEEESIRRFVEYRFYALPMPPSRASLWGAAPKFASGKTEEFLVRYFAAQHSISVVRHEWDSLSTDLFASAQARYGFELKAIENGIFFRIVEALADSETVDSALLSSYQALSDQNNYRAIINSWTANIKSTKKRRSIAREALREEEPEDDEGWFEPKGKADDKNENVKKQQKTIKAQLYEGHVEIARKFAKELISSQLRESDPEYAVMSLCNLAQTANKIGYHSLQLEWLQDAIAIRPEDAWAHGQAGDAFLGLFRFEDARREFELACTLGDQQFGITANARLLVARGELAKALEIFSSARVKFEGHSENNRVWASYADVLRKMYRFDDALAAYNEAIGKFGELSFLYLGRAHLLAEMGRLDDAISAYGYIIDRFPVEVSAFAGLADTHRQMGNYSEALKVFDRGLSRLPGNLYLACAKANFFAATHNYDQALADFQTLVEKNPNELAPRLGLAETLSASGRATEAVSAYKAQIEQWPHDIRLNNGFAKALRRAGLFKEALQQFDKNVAAFPYDAVGLTGRATLLKELGEYEEAEKSYADIMARLPTFHAARFGRASLFAIQGDYQKALELLPIRDPRTRADWVGTHVRGMIALKQGRFEQAEAIFSFGFKNSPFVDQRSYFGNGLTLLKLRTKKFDEAARYAEGGKDAVSNVLLMHSYLVLGELEKAKKEYLHVNDNSLLPRIRQLRDGLAVKFNLLQFGKAPTDEWIAGQEEIILLEAA